MPKMILRLILEDEWGRKHGEVVRPLSEDIARDVQHIEPLSEYTPMSFDSAVKVLKRKSFRKDLFIESARILGTALAERMEDKEGWHGESRREAIERMESGKC